MVDYMYSRCAGPNARASAFVVGLYFIMEFIVACKRARVGTGDSRLPTSVSVESASNPTLETRVSPTRRRRYTRYSPAQPAAGYTVPVQLYCRSMNTCRSRDCRILHPVFPYMWL